MGRGRGVSSGGGQSSLGYLFGGGEAPKPNNDKVEAPRQVANNEAVERPAAQIQKPVSEVAPAKETPAGVPAATTNNYFRAEGQNCGNFITDRPTTKVHAAPGGGSSLDFLFGGGGGK